MPAHTWMSRARQDGDQQESHQAITYDDIVHEFGEITPLPRSRSLQVTDFCTNRQLIYEFLLVINTNLPPILHRFLRYSLR